MESETNQIVSATPEEPTALAVDHAVMEGPTESEVFGTPSPQTPPGIIGHLAWS